MDWGRGKKVRIGWEGMEQIPKGAVAGSPKAGGLRRELSVVRMVGGLEKEECCIWQGGRRLNMFSETGNLGSEVKPSPQESENTHNSK